MVLMETPVCNFDELAYDFNLPDFAGKMHSLKDCQGDNGTLIMFICNHCPYVKSIVDDLIVDINELKKSGIATIAICANDIISFPADSPENMEKFAKQHQFTFPYLFDESQEVARQYDAVCTPDFFGYNKDLKLQYRGRFSTAEKGRTIQNMTHDLLDAMRQIAKTGEGPTDQIASMGCSIKWKE